MTINNQRRFLALVHAVLTETPFQLNAENAETQRCRWPQPNRSIFPTPLAMVQAVTARTSLESNAEAAEARRAAENQLF